MTFSLSRRRATALIAGAAAAPFVSPAHAQERYLDIRPGGQFRPVTIAVTPFVGDAQGAATTQVITNNFSRSVFLQPVDQKSFVEKIANPDQPPQMDSWK